MKSKILLILFSISLIFFISCGSEVQDCSEQNSKYITYNWDEDINECVIDNEIDKDVCGNGVKEEGETFCSCPRDVPNEKLPIESGGCSGNRGDYLEYVCGEESKLCELKITTMVKKDSKLLTLKDGSNLEIESEISYYVPFMKDRHKVNINLMLKNKANSNDHKVEDILIRQIYIVTSSGDLLTSKIVNKPLNELYGSITESLSLDSFTMDTFENEMRNVNLKVLLTYTDKKYNKVDGKYVEYKSDDKHIELKGIFENNFQIIDPKNKNEKLNVDTSWG